VLSIKSECLDRLTIVGERHLRHLIDEYVGHYHTERNHQGLNNRLIIDPGSLPSDSGRVVGRQRLGGLLDYYHRAAA
jgi:putative transposase